LRCQIRRPDVAYGTRLPHSACGNAQVLWHGPSLTAHSSAPRAPPGSAGTISGPAHRPLSNGERAAITALLQQGKSVLVIGTALGRSRSTVAYAATAERTAAARTRVEKRGRPNTVTDRELRTLKQAIYNKGFSSMASVTEMANTTRSQAAGGTKKVTVSVSTVRGTVRAMGFQSRVAAKETFLSAKNVAKRLVWATERRGWTAVWASVLFMDESSLLRFSRLWRSRCPVVCGCGSRAVCQHQVVTGPGPGIDGLLLVKLIRTDLVFCRTDKIGYRLYSMSS